MIARPDTVEIRAKAVRAVERALADRERKVAAGRDGSRYREVGIYVPSEHLFALLDYIEQLEATDNSVPPGGLPEF